MRRAPVPAGNVLLERSTDQGRTWSVFELPRRSALFIQYRRSEERPFFDGVGNLYQEPQ